MPTGWQDNDNNYYFGAVLAGLTSTYSTLPFQPHPTEYIYGTVVGYRSDTGLPIYMGYPKAIWHIARCTAQQLYPIFQHLQTNGNVCYIRTRIDSEQHNQTFSGGVLVEDNYIFNYGVFKAVLMPLEYTTVPYYGYKDVKMTFLHLEPQ